jgi:hypothetical protein
VQYSPQVLDNSTLGDPDEVMAALLLIPKSVDGDGAGELAVVAIVHGTVRVFRQKSTLEDAIGSHACSLKANMHVINGIPLGLRSSYRLTL